MENSAITDQAQRIRGEIIQLRKDLGKSSLHLARLLKLVRDERVYLSWGHPSFDSCLGDPEIGISRSTAYGLIHVWEIWVDKYVRLPDEVAEVPYDKLLLISPLVNDENQEEMFENAKSLSRSDLMKLKEETTGRVGVRISRCPVCHKWKVNSEDVCICQ